MSLFKFIILSKMAKSKKRSGKTKRVKKAIKKRAKKGLIKTMKKIATAAVHKLAEDKILVSNLIPIGVNPITYDAQGMNPSGISGYFQGCIAGQGLQPGGSTNQNVIPLIIQGSGQGAREGNKINVRSFMIRGVVVARNSFYNPASAPPAWQEDTSVPAYEAPVFLHMVVWNRKDQMTGSVATDASRILQGGTGPGTALPIDGSLMRMQYPWNRDAYVIHAHKKFRVGIPPNTEGVSNQFVDRDGWGNGFKCAIPFKVKLKCPKFWKYDDTSVSGPTLANLPTNYNPIVSFYTVNADGTFDWTTTGSVTSQDYSASRVQVQMETVLRYEDV